MNLKLTNPSGTIVTKIITRSGLQQGKLKQIISAVASLSSASFGNLPLDEKLSDGNIELTLEDGKLFNGIGKISGVESSFNGKQTADKKMNIVIKTPLQNICQSRLEILQNRYFWKYGYGCI